MANLLPPERLVRVGQAAQEQVATWKEGASLVSDSGESIDALVLHVAAARWRLARTFLRQGNVSLASRPRSYRTAVSRYYYSMYHAMRAVVYVHHGGDDFEKHTVLPLHVPSDFAGVDWQTKLKDARTLRNRADYDPYPEAAGFWRGRTADIAKNARDLLAASKEYLAQKGCAI